MPTLEQIRPIVHEYDGVPFELVNGQGQHLTVGRGPTQFTLRFQTDEALTRVLQEPSVGFGEAFACGDIVVEGDLERVLTALTPLYLKLYRQNFLGNWVRRWWPRTLAGQKKDIERHYGLGNDFYEFYLDRRLQYSCAYFRTPEDSLDQAQEQKLAYLTDELDLRPGQRLLDLGCGWGHLMFHAAEHYGVRCLGITLCDNQAAYIRAEAAARHLPVEVRVMNFLDLTERDRANRLVSVGMIEHVGQRHAAAFFDKVKQLVAPGGICVLSCIAKMRDSYDSDPFLLKHIFPGYCFLSLEEMVHRAATRGFQIIEIENLRRHYALTAHHWRARFLHNYDAIKARMGFDDKFMRTWDLYLASAVAAFTTGQIHLINMVMSNGTTQDYPWVRQHQAAEPQAPHRPALANALEATSGGNGFRKREGTPG